MSTVSNTTPSQFQTWPKIDASHIQSEIQISCYRKNVGKALDPNEATTKTNILRDYAKQVNICIVHREIDKHSPSSTIQP